MEVSASTGFDLNLWERLGWIMYAGSVLSILVWANVRQSEIVVSCRQDISNLLVFVKSFYFNFLFIILLWSVFDSRVFTPIPLSCVFRYLISFWTPFTSQTALSFTKVNQRCSIFYIHGPSFWWNTGNVLKADCDILLQRATTPWLWLISLIGMMSHFLYFLIASASRTDGIWE